MHLLIELDINGITKRISDEQLALEHPWYRYMGSFTPPQRQTATDHGGFCRMDGGRLLTSPEAWDTWPPAEQIIITTKITESDEAAAITVMRRVGYLEKYDGGEVVHSIRNAEYPQPLLQEADDYDGNQVALPMAAGPVTHVTPVRLPDRDLGEPYGYAPTYHLGGLASSQSAFRIIGVSSHSGGAATEIMTGDIDGNPVNHGYSNGSTVYTDNTDNLDGTGYVISNASGAVFTIAKAFELESGPIYAQVYVSGAVRIADDGVPIPGNFHNNGDGTFSLLARPVGKITMSGSPANTTLAQWMAWGASKLAVGTFTSTYARFPSPQLSKWVTTQQDLIEWLSDICASFTHLFDIDDAADEMTLVDLYLDRGTRNLSVVQFLENPEYSRMEPVKKLSANWTTYEAATGHSGGEHDLTISHYIKSVPHEISENLYDHGHEITVEAYCEAEAAVRTCLVNIKEILRRSHATIEIPMSGAPPAAGERFSWTDPALPVDMPGYIRARDITDDYMARVYRVSGDGTFLQPARMGNIMPDTTVGATTETVDSFDQAEAKGAFWEYVVDDGSRTNMRLGKIAAVWDQAAGSTPQIISDKSGDDIGATLGIVRFSVDKSGGTVRLRCTAASGSWVISGQRRMIR